MNPAGDTGAQFPPLRVGPITPETVAQFSMAQRDFNPIHVSAAAAQAAGFDGPIVHGVFIIGQFERLIRSWQAMDMLSLQGRFLRPVPVGAALVLSVRVLETAGDELHMRLLAKNDQGTLVATGEARLRITAGR